MIPICDHIQSKGSDTFFVACLCLNISRQSKCSIIEYQFHSFRINIEYERVREIMKKCACAWNFLCVSKIQW